MRRPHVLDRALMLRSCVRIALLGGVVLVGCGEETPTRVWEPSDHGHPPESQVDPSRVPARAGAAGEAPADPETARRRAAEALWRVSCAGCHGPTGLGGGPELPPGAQPPNLTDPQWQQEHTDAELAAVIRDGRGMMPPFGDRIRPQGVEALVAHVRSLARPGQAP